MECNFRPYRISDIKFIPTTSIFLGFQLLDFFGSRLCPYLDFTTGISVSKVLYFVFFFQFISNLRTHFKSFENIHVPGNYFSQKESIEISKTI